MQALSVFLELTKKTSAEEKNDVSISQKKRQRDLYFLCSF